MKQAFHRKTKRSRRIIYISFSLTMAVFAYITATAAAIWNYGKLDEKRPADTAVILGAAAYQGRLSPVFRERVNHGIWLYQNGYVKKIIMTGGYGTGNPLPDSYTAKQYAKSQGVPEEDILCEEQSTITQENLRYAKEIMEAENYRSAILVSDPLHMKRAMAMAEDYGITAYSSPTPTTMYRSWKKKFVFLGREVFFYIGYQIYRKVDTVFLGGRGI